MLKILPFSAVRYDPRKVPLSRVLCPPYDVISESAAARLRAWKYNAIHLESPNGGPGRYVRAAAAFKRWMRDGVLRADERPGYYLVEQRFRFAGKTRRRVGLLAALGLDAAGPGNVRPHEKTLTKPKKDRLRVLSTLKVNTSPIFGLYSDSSASLRRIFLGSMQGRPIAAGRALGGEAFRVWRIADSKAATVGRLFKPKKIFIADGHHRFEVAKAYWRRGHRRAGRMLIYLCAEEDPGLLVLPTHRVLVPPGPAWERVRALCRLSPCPLRHLEGRLARRSSPYAFGVCDDSGRVWIAVPKSAGGARSGLVVEWLARNLAADVDPHRILYTHELREAVRIARREKGLALIVPAVGVRAIRKAADAIGLLPQKSTYFYPKIATGLAFHRLS